jgi:cell division protein FtsN
MYKSIRFILAISVIMVATTACKTKQKIVEIPAGAKITATAPKPDIKLAAPAPAYTEPEVVRNETFSLVDGEKDALKNKYHVVVGSFKSQENAKGLQKTLNTDGNKAIIVINENQMYRVLIASFNDYIQAHVKIKEIADRFSDAWVLVQK